MVKKFNPIKALYCALAIVMCASASNINFKSESVPEVDLPDSSVVSQPQTTKIKKFKKEFGDIVDLLPMSVLADVTSSALKEIRCMALNNYYEAATEGVAGMKAVSQVVLNRTDEKGFPQTACGVIHQKTNYTCQFSWVCAKSLPKLNTDSDAWKNAVQVAKVMYIDGHTVSGLENALFYHATYVNPKWKRVTKVKQVGAHIFYKKKEIA